MPGPQISVVIPVWNDQEWLGGAIESVLAQTLPDWELVVGDNASDADLVGSMVRTVPRRSAHSLHALAAARWCIRESQPQHDAGALSVDSGAVRRRSLAPDCLERIATTIAQTTCTGSELAMVVTACQRVDELGRPADIVRQDRISYRPVRRQLISGGTYDAARWLTVNAAPGLRPWMIGSVAIRGDILVESGGFRPDMGLSHDLELTMRVAAYGDVVYIDEPLLDYTVRAGSITMQLERRHVRIGGAMVEEGLAWLSALRAHELRRTVTSRERAVVSGAIARAFLRRALLQRGRRGYPRARWDALTDVLRAVRHSPPTALGTWRLGVALGAIVAPDWLLSQATALAHRFGVLVV